MDKIKVVAYCRVSSGSVEQATSLVNQEAYFKEFCKEKDNYILEEIYPEDGVSGTKLTRPQFTRMLYNAGVDVEYVSNGEPHFIASEREPEFTRILTKDSSRFARNSEAMQAVEKLRQKGVFVDFTTIGLSSEDVSSDVMLKILMAIDAQDSKNKSTNVTRGHRQGMMQDIPVIPGLSYGYYKDSDKKLHINEKQADVVKDIFDLYVNYGLGARAIVKICKEKGYKSKRGKDFGVSSITLMIKNPIYKRTLIRGKHDFSTIGGKKIDMLKINDKYFTFPNHPNIPEIISTKMWDKAQEIMTSKITFSEDGSSTRGKRKAQSKYRGMIKCSICGSTYRLNTDRGRKFYTCGNKRENGVKACHSYNINETEIDKQIENYVRGMYKDFIDVDVDESIEILESMIGLIDVKMNEDKNIKKINELKTQLKEVHNKVEKLVDMSLASDMNVDIFTKKNDELETKRTDIIDVLRVLDKTVDEYNTEISKINETIERLERVRVQTTFTREETLNELEYLTVITVTPEEWKIRMGDNADSKSFKRSYKQMRNKVMPTFKSQILIAELMIKYN